MDGKGLVLLTENDFFLLNNVNSTKMMAFGIILPLELKRILSMTTKFAQAFIFLLFTSLTISAQSNGLKVYEILQEHCVTCHSNASPTAGLDLEGAGSTVDAKWAAVYDNLIGQTPQNTYAAGRGYDIIHPGRQDLSFLFRKINNGLEPTFDLADEAGDIMPKNNPDGMSDYEKEVIRQWINFGARENDNAFDTDVIATYYDTGGEESFPDGPPPAPAPEEGFQIKVGPFFLSPGGSINDELEFFQKYALDLPADTEVHRLDTKISGSSHHFIAYSYDFPAAANNIEPGLRLNSYHNNVSLVMAVQGASDIRLPEGSAFKWDNDIILDLNSHYINYSLNLPYKAEAYLNVYTQEAGTAAQEMKTDLIANLNIIIPNNEENITLGQSISGNGGDAYLWALMGHTHKYGTGYKVWKREGGERTDLLYDGACAEAVPDCVFPEFDYQHIPIRYFDQFEKINFASNNGLYHEASWMNDGPNPVFFGPTSDDEMMVLVIMYLEDLEGVNTNVDELPDDLSTRLSVYPNPMADYTEFTWENKSGANYKFKLMDSYGRVVRADKVRSGYYQLQKGDLYSGVYFYEISNEFGIGETGKLIIE